MASHTPHQEQNYHPQDALAAAMKATTLTGGVGLFASAVQNTLTKQNVGPMGVFVKSGSTIGIFGMRTLLGFLSRGGINSGIGMGVAANMTVVNYSGHGWLV